MKFFIESLKYSDFKIKIILYDSKILIKARIIVKEYEISILFDGGNSKKYKDEKELVGGICQKKFFDALASR